MTTDLELNELKHAWRALDTRLSAEHALRIEDLLARRLETVRRTLLPLYWSHLALIAFGVFLVVLGVHAWSASPVGDAVFVSGVVMHAYGVVTIIGAGVFLTMLARLDYGAPVLAIQSQTLRLRVAYRRMGWVLGVPWAVMWLPLFLCVTRMHAPNAAWLWLNIVISLVILGVVALFTRRAHRANSPAAESRHLARAQTQLDDLARFEREE